MCLLVISYKFHPKYKMIVAANRDEFYNRPAEPAKFWDDKPEILAGKDLLAGGTWLGITKQGRFAAITNYRDLSTNKENAPSRGNLTLSFLENNISPKLYANMLLETAKMYNGYNLIFGDKEKLFYFSNHALKIIELTPGIYGLSNHLLDTPWPKVEKSKTSFQMVLNNKDINEDELFEILTDRSIPSDGSLPNTGLPPEIERAVSPVFVETPFYGTRSSSVIFWDKNDEVNFYERSLEPSTKRWTSSSYNFGVKQF